MNAQTESKSILSNPTVIKRAIIYNRVSTDEQAETGTSLDNQDGKSLAYVAAHNMYLVAHFREDYSGKTLDRPELNKVRAMLRAGQADALIVYKTNRLDRSEWGINLLILLQELKALGVELHYSQQGRQIDLSNPVEALMQSISGWQAGEDHRETVTKLKEGRFSKVKQGSVMLGFSPPLGYEKIREKNMARLEIIPEQARIIEHIFHWYVFDNMTIWAIAKRLTSDGVLTPSDLGRAAKPRKNRKKGWNVPTLSKILNNETYAGIWRYGKTVVINGKRIKGIPDDSLAVAVPAIVSHEVWEAAQIRLKENKKHARRNRKHEYLLAGHCVCTTCGYSTTGRTSNGYGYYGCPNSSGRQSVKDCDLPFFRVDKADTIVWAWVEETLTDADKLKKGMRGYQSQQESEAEPIRRELAYVEQLIKDKTAEWEDDYASIRFLPKLAKAKKGVEMAQTEQVLKELEKRKADLLAELEDTTLTDEQIKAIEEFAVQVRDDIETVRQHFESKRDFLALIKLRVRFALEDGQKIAHITCKIGIESLSVVNIPSCGNEHNQQKPIVITARLVIG